MKEQDFLKIKHLLDQGFIFGHKLRVKSVEQIDEICENDSSLKYRAGVAFRNAGKILISSHMEGGYIELYTGEDPRFKFSTIGIRPEFLELCGDDRKPSKKAYELANKLIEMNVYFMCGTSGELHGRGEDCLLTADVVFPVLRLDGESRIHIPRCGVVSNSLELNIVEELIEKRTYNASFSTGMSYIRRILSLFTEEEVNSKRYEY